MKTNQIKAGAILSYATQFVHIISGVVYTPIMLRLLGQSEYGLYQLVASIISYLGILNFGFNGCYIRFYSQLKAKKNDEEIAKFNAMFFLVFLVITAVCFICGGFFVANADIVFGKGLTTEELSKAQILLTIMVVNLGLTFINSVFSSYVSSQEKFFFQRIIEFLKTLLNPFLVLPLLIMGYGSIGMVLISLFLTVVALLLNVWYCFKKINMKFKFKKLNFKLLGEMWTFTFFIFISMITDQLNQNIGKFLLGRYAGTIAVAIYGVSLQLKSMYVNFSSTVFTLFSPRVNKIVAETDDNNLLTNLFIKVGRIQFVIVVLILTAFTIFGKSFIFFWAGNEYAQSYYIAVLLMLSIAGSLVMNLGIEIRRAKNLHKQPAIVMVFIALFNLIISIPAINVYGALGAAVATMLSHIINLIYINVYYQKSCKLNLMRFYKSILSLSKASIIPVIFGVILSLSIPDNVILLFSSMLLYTIVYFISMWFFGFNKNEKQMVINLINKFKFKKNMERT